MTNSVTVTAENDTDTTCAHDAECLFGCLEPNDCPAHPCDISYRGGDTRYGPWLVCTTHNHMTWDLVRYED